MADVGIATTTGHDQMDLEMQLLQPWADQNRGRSSRQVLQRVVLVIRYSLLFISAARDATTADDHHQGSPPVISRVSSSKSTNDSSTHETARSTATNMEEDDEIGVEAQSLVPLLDPVDNGSQSWRQKMRTLIHVVYSSQIFRAGASVSAGADEIQTEQGVAETGDSLAASSQHCISIGETKNEMTANAHQKAKTEANVELVGCETAAVPLLKPVDNSTPRARQQMRTLIHVLYSSMIFKAAASGSAGAATAYVHLSNSDEIETEAEVAEVAEAGDSSSEHCITIAQTIKNPLTVNDRLQRSQSQNISKIVREKDFVTLQEFGGLGGVADALSTDLERGISDDEALNRRKLKAYSLRLIPALGFTHFVLKAFKNITILLLSVAAALSFVFGIKQEGLKNGWFDGTIILITIIILILFDSIREYRQEQRARRKLEEQHLTKYREGEVHVIRGGTAKCVCSSELVYGDIVLLKKGSQVPADGFFVDGQDLELDNGSESEEIDGANPFLSYGERVVNGNARMVVTSVDLKTEWSELMIKATGDPDRKFKLEAHLNKLTSCIHITGLVISILILVVLFLRYTVGEMDDDYGNRLESKAGPSEMSNFINSLKKIIQERKCTGRYLTMLLSLSLVGITEGVPFVVSLATLHWNYKTLLGKATEQDLLAVAKMASVTCICTDKLGDFTEDDMEVETVFIGKELVSGCTMISPDVLEPLCDGISTSMEESILSWAEDKWGLRREKMEQSCTIFKKTGKHPFEEPCAVLMRTGESEKMCLHWNGPAKEILKMCTHYYDSKGRKTPMDSEAKRFFDDTNKGMLCKQSRTIAFACKCTDTPTVDAEGLILVALLGLKYNRQEATRTAIEAFREYGVKTILVSREKVPVLQKLAVQCGLITTGDSEALVLTGEAFRKLSDKERIEKVDKICIMAEALLSDKLLFVEYLKRKGEVVVFLGQRTDEAPALKEADIGIAMGTWSPKAVRENSDIIMLYGSFADLIIIVKSGKCIVEHIKKYLQLVLIMTISSTLINLILTAVSGDGPLTAVQLIWVNLTVSLLLGYALLTEPFKDESVLLVPVSGRSLITADMIRNIAIQVIYEVSILVTLQVKGSGIKGTSQKDIKSMVFYSFIIFQLFNQFTARELEKKNFFKGIHHCNKWFWVCVAAFVVLQGVFVIFEDILGYGSRLDWKLWAVCFLIGAVSWLIDCLGKSISEFLKTVAMQLHDHRRVSL